LRPSRRWRRRAAGLLGFFGYFYVVIPKVTVYPILIFIGLEIAAQSFHATPQRHYPAVVLACLPALAQLGLIFIDKLHPQMQTVRILANGFIVTSLLWASALAAIIDRRLWRAAVLFAVCGACTLVGIIHSPLPGSPMFLPWQLAEAVQHHVYPFAAGYACASLLLLGWGWLLRVQGIAPNDDQEPPHAA
jgi:AGZA family xanthine/uracil permease-like MFS transporter